MQPSGRTCFWCFNHFKHNNPARDKSRSSSELERVFPRNRMCVLWNIIWGFVVRLYAVRLLTCKPSRNARSDSFALEMAAGLFARLIMLPFCRLVLRRAIRPRFFRWLARSADPRSGGTGYYEKGRDYWVTQIFLLGAGCSTIVLMLILHSFCDKCIEKCA